MTKKICIILLTMFTCWYSVNAQNYYLFEKKAAAYAELMNDTIVEGALSNPTGVWMLELTGENFSFFDKPYPINNVNKHIVFSNNGFVRIEDDSTFIVLDAAFTYSDSIDASSKVSYIVTGTPGNLIIKVQWKNLKLSSGQPGNFVNYQVWLYQKTGVFEIYYGPSSASNQSGYTVSNGPNIGLFYSLKSFTTMFEKIWINGAPGSYTIDSNRTVVFNAVSGVPVSGTMFRFVPKKVLAGVTKEKATENIATIFPNPSGDKIYIALRTGINEQADIQLFDMSGKHLLSSQIKQGQDLQSISVHDLPAGLYTITIKAGQKEYVQPIEVRH